MSKKKTPMMEQYYELKSQYPNEILFFRLGDFYEMFYADAELVSKELELTLTGRAAGNKERAPMCGVPFHSANSYIYRLTQKGYRVAICEQLEDPKAVKGIVKRAVVKVITPGTILLEDCLQEDARNYLAYLYEEKDEISISMVEVSVGECRWGIFSRDCLNDALDILGIYAPSEIILEASTQLEIAVREYVNTRIGNAIITSPGEVGGLQDCGGRLDALKAAVLPRNELVRKCLEKLFAFLESVLKTQISHITTLLPLREEKKMLLDNNCLRHLEVVKNLRDGSKRGTLLELLDYTMTAMGKRLLSRWLEMPLTDVNEIVMRQDAIGSLLADNQRQSELRRVLANVFDFERILTRIEMNTAAPKDLLALRDSLEALPELRQITSGINAKLFSKWTKEIGEHGAIRELLSRSISEEASLQKNGNYIRSGYSAELDELRELVNDNRAWIRELEEKEKDKTGIKLKIGFNNVFGYYFEVPNSNTKQIPEYFVRKQTLANAERYITPDLKEFEVKVLTAQEHIKSLEASLFNEIKSKVSPCLVDMQWTAKQVAELDCIVSLAQAAMKYRYIRPVINNKREILIQDGRHPMLEASLQHDIFVPNDTALSHTACEVMLITGPNMAGKSTYMRQVAILVLMAQVGSYIPAREASIGPVDRIFTRIGASDDISTGQSTFMVEMREVANILDNATENSLVLLDEIGRGTSTYDGMSIARAVIEYITENIHAFTLFATHYHELTTVSDENNIIGNFTVSVKEVGKEIRFLRRIVHGKADRSYGVHVARLAGLPKIVIENAENILSGLESNAKANEFEAKAVLSDVNGDDLFTAGIWEELALLDVMSLTPIEAMDKLYKLNQEAKRRKEI